MAITIIVAIVAVAVALLIAVPITCKVAVFGNYVKFLFVLCPFLQAPKRCLPSGIHVVPDILKGDASHAHQAPLRARTSSRSSGTEELSHPVSQVPLLPPTHPVSSVGRFPSRIVPEKSSDGSCHEFCT